MRFTGERVIPHRYELKPMLQEHSVRYEFASTFAKGAKVIDLGCGCGYGAYLLASRGAESVVGVDLFTEAIDYSRSNYQAPNLSFEVMDVAALRFPDEYFEVVICLEVFEHVENCQALLNEAARVLSPGGTLILSTPNKLVWSPGRERPINPWHVREFERDELFRLLDDQFDPLRFWVQTNPAPGIIPFILANLQLQGYYIRNRSRVARLVEWLHATAMKVVMLPTLLISGATDKNPNVILPEEEIPAARQHYFIAVGKKRFNESERTGRPLSERMLRNDSSARSTEGGQMS